MFIDIRYYSKGFYFLIKLSLKVKGYIYIYLFFFMIPFNPNNKNSWV